MRRIRIIALKVLWGGLGLLIIYLSLAVILSLAGTSPEQNFCVRDHSMFVATNGVHLDLILPASAYSKVWEEQIILAQRSNYLSFGWGDLDFYVNTPQWKDLTPAVAIKAVLLQSEAALHVTGHLQKQDHWIEVPVCEEQINIIIAYVENTFKTEAGTLSELPQGGYGASDTFYKARGSYNIIRTCNTWVNNGLKAAEIKTSIWSPFDYGVLYHLRKQVKE